MDDTHKARAYDGSAKIGNQYVGLPVEGYKTQSELNVHRVNIMKQLEERVLRAMDALADDPNIDKRWLAIGRTDIEKGFMAANRSIFQPGRARLPEDAQPA
jgi:hypothetical protein